MILYHSCCPTVQSYKTVLAWRTRHYCSAVEQRTYIASQRSRSMHFCFVSGESLVLIIVGKSRRAVCQAETAFAALVYIRPMPTTRSCACLKQHQRPQTLRLRTHGPSTPPVRRIPPFPKPHVCHRFLSPLIIMATPYLSLVGSPQRPPTTPLGCARQLAQRATTRLL